MSDYQKDKGNKGCVPLLRVGFGFVNDICNGSTHTLVESAVFPMGNVTADMRNMGDCPVTYHFLTTKGQTIDKTLQPGQSITIQVPGRIILITGTCECACCNGGGGYYNNCEFGVLVYYTQCVCCCS